MASSCSASLDESLDVIAFVIWSFPWWTTQFSFKKCSSLDEALSTLKSNWFPRSNADCPVFELCSRPLINFYRAVKARQIPIIVFGRLVVGLCCNFGQGSRYGVYFHSITSPLMYGIVLGALYLTSDYCSTNRRRPIMYPCCSSC